MHGWVAESDDILTYGEENKEKINLEVDYISNSVKEKLSKNIKKD